jgi:WhiB family redox-sensing transcriptional regulator
MLNATVPCDGGALPDYVLSDRALSTLEGVGGLLDGVSSDELELPCRAGNPDLWFAEAPAELEQAKLLCADCPIRAQCLEGALARREPWGVWGGEIFERGAVVARKRPRGRPRKTDQTRETDRKTNTKKREIAA